jgi:hypothetical protein
MKISVVQHVFHSCNNETLVLHCFTDETEEAGIKSDALFHSSGKHLLGGTT